MTDLTRLLHAKAIALGERALRITEDGRPLAVIARTVKGWGVPSLGGPGHHGTPVKQEALAGVLAELDTTAQSLGVADIGAQDLALLKIAPPATARSVRAALDEPMAPPSRAFSLPQASTMGGRANCTRARASGRSKPAPSAPRRRCSR